MFCITKRETRDWLWFHRFAYFFQPTLLNLKHPSHFKTRNPCK